MVRGDSQAGLSAVYLHASVRRQVLGTGRHTINHLMDTRLTVGQAEVSAVVKWNVDIYNPRTPFSKGD
jgi:hypothetical protein